jgi:fermentation-respiration switch protein FrsA (DUF1100 family)
MPWLPLNLMLSTRMNSLAKIKDYHGPLLLCHGDADEVVPYEQGEALFAAAPGPKRLITARGGKHNDPQPEEYRVALDEFINQLPRIRGKDVKTASLDVR